MRNTRPPSKGPRNARPSGGKSHGRKPSYGKPAHSKAGAGKPERSRTDYTKSDGAKADYAKSDRPRKDYAKPAHARKEYPKTDYGRGEKRERTALKAAAPVTFKPREPRERANNPRLQGPLLWGFHAVRAAWANPARRILRLIVTDAGLSGFTDTLETKVSKRPEPEIVDKLLLERLLPAGAVHQGIVALVEPLAGRDAHDLIAGLKDDEPAVIVILDQVTDPHNVGAILRSAAAFGAKGIIMQDRHAPELTGVLAKTASGAVDAIAIATETNLSRGIELLQENGFVVVGLDERGDAISALPKHNRVALVLGAEGAGLRQNVASHCDALVSLPTEGPILSLNVSNAAAVALYAIKS